MNPTTVRALQSFGRLSSRWAPGLAAAGLTRAFLTAGRRAVHPREVPWMADAVRLPTTLSGQIPGAGAGWLAGRQVMTYRWGDPTRPTVWLMHGWASRASQVALFAGPLVEAGFCVRSHDAPCHGESAGKLGGLPELGWTLDELIQRHREDAHDGVVGPLRGVVAHSLGCAATTLALCSGAGAGRKIDRFEPDPNLAGLRLVYVAPPKNSVAALRRAGTKLHLSDQVLTHTRVRIESRYRLPMTLLDHERLGPYMPQRLWVAHGTADAEVPFDEGKAVADHWKQARFLAIEGLGHNRVLAHDSVLAMVRDAMELTP